MEIFLDRLQLIRVMVKDSRVFSIPEQLVLRHTPLMSSKLSRIKQALMGRHLRGTLEESTKVCLGEVCGGRDITFYPCSCPKCMPLASSYFFNKVLICSTWYPLRRSWLLTPRLIVPPQRVIPYNTKFSGASWASLVGSAGKESACNLAGSIPWLGRSPPEGKGYPLQYSGLENPTDCLQPMGSQRVGHN